ncbi:MAG: DUF3810 domain-containing protein [Oscillospiraceae bacterium]|jgi:hypothetical protein|nr:DUF3810 domain-containing protein [Oscillospiraceae bacterium]MBQ6159501.1 DUF3810 domain-containing protein [Oscillospiraceae bacterium]
MFKPVRHLIGAAILAALTAAAVGLAKFLPGLWFSFYTDFSRGAMKLLGAAFGWVPFPVWEVLLVLLVFALLAGLVYAVKKARILGYLTAVLELAVLAVALFMGLWGLNHFAPTIGEQTGLEVREYTTQELKAAAAWYADRASEWSVRVERDEAGDLVMPEFETLSDEALAAYARLAEENERFADPAPRVKPLLVSKAFAYMGTTGIFVCLTGEASVSTETFSLAQPFTVCHELGHSLAVAREDEANYLGFLACRASDSALLRYSGYYSAFVYCYNALYAESPSQARTLWDRCTEELIHDTNVHVEHNKQYEGKVQKAAQAVNDAYLKTFTEAGVKSYGLVVDYLIAEYLKTAN